MVSFSMQLTKIKPSPFFASMVRPICRRCASARRPRSNCTTALSLLLMLNLYSFVLSLTKVVSKRRSDTSSTMASEICPIPFSRAASRASSDVEISTPIPPIMMGTYSFLPNRRRKSSTRFIAILRLPWLSLSQMYGQARCRSGARAHVAVRSFNSTPSGQALRGGLPACRCKRGPDRAPYRN